MSLKIVLMKWVVYFLILVNLGFVLWHYRSQDLTGTAFKEDDDTLRLVLLKEYLAQESREKSQTAPSDKALTARCYTLGPFKDKKLASAVRKQLLAVGIEARHRLSKDNTRKGFWVLLPPEKTRAAASQHIKALKVQGIKDYFLVVTGEQTNAVSLGVFSQSDSAQRRYEQMKKLGFDARVMQVDLPLREYWLDWPLNQQLLPEVLAKFRKQHEGIGQTQRSCSIE